MSFWKRAIATSVLTLTCLTAAFGTKLSYAYFANAVTGNNSNAHGSLATGDWRDINTSGTAISTAAGFFVMLDSNNGNTYHLTNSIDFNGVTWTPGNHTFSGKFYGNGYSLSNMTIPNAHKGIFTTTSAATLQNFYLNNVKLGTSSSRAPSASGLLVGTNSGDNTAISKVRIINSSIYTSGNNGTGGIIGASTKVITITNSSVVNTIVNGSGTQVGGLIGAMSNSATVTDVYVEATITGTQQVGGLYGSLANGSTTNTITRAIVYSTVTASTNYAAGLVGYNASNKTHVITDFLFTGQLNSPSNNAGIITNNIVMGYSNGWFSQWSSTNINPYTNMVGRSVPWTNYVALRTSLTTSWWGTNIPSFNSSLLWTYNNTSHLYNLVAIA